VDYGIICSNITTVQLLLAVTEAESGVVSEIF